jgi:hypothetical protein
MTDRRSRLLDYIETVRREPFEYGKCDCGLFAAGAVAAMTGTDPAEALRGRYSTFAGGIKKLRQAGYPDHVAMAAALYAKVPRAEAQVCDIAVLNSEDGPALGMVGGARAFFMRPTGLGSVSILDARVRSHVYRVLA